MTALTVDIIVFDGVDELDAIGPYRVFKGAARAGVTAVVRLVTRTAQPTVTCSCGLVITPDAVYTPGSARVLVVPGGGWATRSDSGAWGEVQRGHWLPLLADAIAAPGVVVMSVCTGALLLARSGGVAGRRLGTHHSAVDDLAALGVRVVRDRVVDDGDVVSSGGVTSGVDAALWLLARELSPAVADVVAGNLEYAWSKPVAVAHAAS